ncbi:hypothetical protein Tco_0542027 [Tanacetum coccineum]
MNELNELRDQAYKNSLIYKEKTKRIHDSKIKNLIFNVEPPDVEICLNLEPYAAVINDFDELYENECFDPGGGEINVSQNVEDDDSFTYVIRTFLPYLTYPVDSPLLLSTGSEDTIFDPGISAFHFSLKPVAFASLRTT